MVSRFKRTTSGIIIPDNMANTPQQTVKQVPAASYKTKNPPLVGRVITCCICGLSGGSLVKIDSERYRHTFCIGGKKRN